MTRQSVYGASVVVLAFSVVTVGPASAQRRDGSLLPQDQSGQVTAVGCLVRGDAVRGGAKGKYVLARPRRGPVASVPEATCTTDPGADALMLDNPEKANISDAMLGRWVEIGGRLESETGKNPDDLRELDVVSAKAVPVVVPPRPTAATPNAAQPTSPAPPEASAASGTQARSLPKTASRVPAIGLAGLLLLAVGVSLLAFRQRQRG